MDRPDYLNSPASVRKKLTEKPKKPPTEQYRQAVIGWVIGQQPNSQKGLPEQLSSGASDGRQVGS